MVCEGYRVSKLVDELKTAVESADDFVTWHPKDKITYEDDQGNVVSVKLKTSR